MERKRWRSAKSKDRKKCAHGGPSKPSRFRYDQGPTSEPEQCEKAYTREPVLVKWIHGFLRTMPGDWMVGLEPHRVWANFVKSLLDCPNVERRSGDLVHNGNCKPINGHVHRLQVILAGIASFHPHGRHILY